MKKQKGFTLVELLVVIAILAVLLTLLAPAFKKARDQAKAAVCLSHVHHWGSIFAMYTDDYEERFMPGWDESTTGGHTWINLLRPYYGDGADFILCPRASQTVGEGGIMPWAAWDASKPCP